MKYLIRPAYLPIVMIMACLLATACAHAPARSPSDARFDMADGCDRTDMVALERDRILKAADAMLNNEPRTVTADRAARSSGGPNDFYSEGDYWWPVPGQPDAAYERRDGQTNPDNFVAHRLSMMRLADHIGVLVSAWQITGDARYSRAAQRHLTAWFVNPDTQMAPRLLYAQAIKGLHTGRSIGLIDTVHLVEVARGAKSLIDAGQIPEDDARAIRGWFQTYANWMNSHPYGIEERDWYNNHSIAWSLQIAAYADLTGDETLMRRVREKFKSMYLARMMNEQGGFTDELKRTKPYGYSLFVIDLMAGVAHIASTPDDDLWTYETPEGRSMQLGLNFMAPYVADRSGWPYGKDIQHRDDWPVRHPFLLLGGTRLKRCDWVALAAQLPATSDVYEVRRNWPLRHPLLWID